MKQYQNPIISGPYSDPSICRVDDVYYMVHSSFEYFPAIPVWESRDLVHWQQIGNAVDSGEQGLRLEGVAVSGGIQAASIRHHDGVFYITSTCVERQWPRLDYHIILSATNPAGPWELHYIENAPGIDSSLFFDDDGTAYFMANCIKEEPSHEGDSIIWIQEIDLNTMQLIGERSLLWDGTGGNYPEGPHIYKRNGWYYLLVAEGGTLHWHTVTMARSKSLRGPYVSVPRNPLLTHKHMHRSYPIQNVGHADLVETQNGEWWLVCLGSRPRGGFYNSQQLEWSFGGYYRNLGRETFLVPVVWEDDFGPLVAPFTGRVEEFHPFPNLDQVMVEKTPLTLDTETLPFEFVTIRDTTMKHINFQKGKLTLKLHESKIDDDQNGSIIGIRQTDWKFQQNVIVDVQSLCDGDEVGVASYFNYRSHNRLSLRVDGDTLYCQTMRTFKGDVEIVDEVALPKANYQVVLNGNDQDYQFSLFLKEECLFESSIFDGRNVSADLNDGHTGAMIMLYGSGNSESKVMFTEFNYSPLSR